MYLYALQWTRSACLRGSEGLSASYSRSILQHQLRRVAYNVKIPLRQGMALLYDFTDSTSCKGCLS